MPEAAVDEDGEFFADEGNVGTDGRETRDERRETRGRRKTDAAVKAVAAEARVPEGFAERATSGPEFFARLALITRETASLAGTGDRLSRMYTKRFSHEWTRMSRMCWDRPNGRIEYFPAVRGIRLSHHQRLEFLMASLGSLPEVVVGLHADPKLRAGAQGVREAEGHFGGDPGGSV